MRTPLAALLLTLLLSCSFAPTATAHPHAFVEASLTFVFDEKGLAGFRQSWVLDEMLSLTLLEMVDHDGNFAFSPAEAAELEEMSMSGLGEYSFYTHVLIDGKPFPVQYITGFTPSLRGAKIVYDFFVPCHVSAAATPKEIKVALYDDSFYTYVSYVEEGTSSEIDPTRDALFGEPTAGPSAGDFARFSEAVGATGYAGAVKTVMETGDGPVPFTVTTNVADAPEMVYFYDQIVPQAFSLRFQQP